MTSPTPHSTNSADVPTYGQRLLEAFDSIADLPPVEREAALEALRVESPELERAVRALLARDDRTGPLDRPLAADLAPLLRDALPELDTVPAQIGPYQVLRLLGEGGMGRVYLARRSEGPISREVALKLIRPDRAGEGLLARFEAERRHLAALDHPGICRFIDADSLADGTPYVVMEAVHGEPIIDYCQRHALGMRGRVELLRELLAAVAHAHDRLLLHRDIKPHNVLVTADGQPKLLDFGIAKSIEDAHASVTRTAERFFTPNASAPEQLLGQPAGVACDVYSLGALAYELLSDALPFDFQGLRAAEIERLILQVAPPLMSERSTQPWTRELRGDLDAIVATCLRKSPTERYPNVGALDAELQRWLEGHPVSARAPSWAYRSRLFIRRHRTAVGLSAALGLAIAVFGTGLALQSLELREQRNLAVIERDRALQVVEILESAFRNADPGQSAGDKVTARQILDAAIPAIDAMENDQPALFARLAATLAKVELSLNQWNEAGNWAERGLNAIPKDSTQRDIELPLLQTAVIANSRLGNVRSAQQQFTRLDTLKNSSDPGYIFAKSRLLIASSQYPDAVETMSIALSRSELNDFENEHSHATRWLLAEILSQSGKIDEGVEILTKTIEWQAGTLPPDHPWAIITKTERLRLLLTYKPQAELLQEFTNFSPHAEQILGSSSLRTIFLRRSYGIALFELGRKNEGIEAIERATEAQSTLLGPSSFPAIQASINLSTYLVKEGSRDSLMRASDLLVRASEDSIKAFGHSAPVAFVAKIRLCEALALLERWSDASACLDQTADFSDSATRHATGRSFLSRVATMLLGSNHCKHSTNAESCERIATIARDFQHPSNASAQKTTTK